MREDARQQSFCFSGPSVDASVSVKQLQALATSTNNVIFLDERRLTKDASPPQRILDPDSVEVTKRLRELAAELEW